MYIASESVTLEEPVEGALDEPIVTSADTLMRDRPPGIPESGPAQTPDPYARWADLVARIQAGDPSGMEELYRVFSRGVRFYLCRQLGPQEIDDKVHDAFLIVIQAIQRGDLREPQRLMGFVRTVVRRQVAAYIDSAVQNRREHADLDSGSRVLDETVSPEESVMREQRAEIMREILHSVSPRDREILTRFYIREQTQEEICEEMSLSETQFRLLKSRAKARFGELGRRKLASRPLNRWMKAAGGQL
jgi:RNA polymerase sigma-70 factor, ECF subfamily